MRVRRREIDAAGVAVVELEHEDFPTFRFVLTLAPPDGALIVLQVWDRAFSREVERVAEGGEEPDSVKLRSLVSPITRRSLASLPLGELEATARDIVSKDLHDFMKNAEELPEGREWLVDVALAREEPRKPGRPADPGRELFLAEIAREYVEADSKRPIATIADERQWPRETVKGWIREARKRGLLARPAPSTSPTGKAAGVLTQKAKAILNIEEET